MASILLDERRCPDVRALIRDLNAAGIQARPLWRPLHLQPAFQGAQAGPVGGGGAAVRARALVAVLGRHHAAGAAGRRGRGRAAAFVSRAVELRDRLRRYYTTYYRDVLGIPDWSALVGLREDEERQERGRLDRLRRLLGGDAALRGRILNVGCGTGGFNLVAEAGRRPRGRGGRGRGGHRDLRRSSARRAGAPSSAPPPSGCRSRTATFDVVYCFSSIEHVESVEESVAEMVRVTRRGGLIYVHTPNAWSWYEGHYKLLWAPFLPAALGRALPARAGSSERVPRDAAAAHARRRCAGPSRGRACAISASTTTSRRGSRWGRLRVPIGLYYRLSGVSPFIEVVARKP